jgi:antirestriction protein ArdC
MDVYQIVTDAILERLDQGVIPWRKRWTQGVPKSLATHREYHGINILILGSQPYSSRYWVTLNEANRLGGRVNKGEKSKPVIYWHWRTEKEKDELRMSGKTASPAPCIPYVSRAFNLEQVTGIERPEDDFIPVEELKMEHAETVINSMPNRPSINHNAMGNPSYNVQKDEIRIPNLGQFEVADLYYLTLFHELIHSTGHPSRLARFDTRAEEVDGDKGYSFEELVAEFGAAFLSSLVGIDSTQTIDDSAGYIEGWASAFRKDKNLLLRAASNAQKAADFIQGKRLIQPLKAAA